jgi:hypothetical protein
MSISRSPQPTIQPIDAPDDNTRLQRTAQPFIVLSTCFFKLRPYPLAGYFEIMLWHDAAQIIWLVAKKGEDP